MFKFEVIESTQRIFKNNFIKSMIEKMKFFQGIEISLKSRRMPIFIVAEGNRKKILGGTCLLKKNINEIQEDVRELVTTLTLHNLSHFIMITCGSVQQFTSTLLSAHQLLHHQKQNYPHKIFTADCTSSLLNLEHRKKQHLSS